jgi:hypothetical protein
MSVTGIGRIALAEKMSVDQLEAALQNKTLPAYIAIPLIEEKTSMAERAQIAQAAQQNAMRGTEPPIGDVVLQRARAVQQGIDALPTNLPMQEAQGMAGGGIVAFEGGGPISFQNQGLVQGPGTPFSRTAVGRYFSEADELARLRSQLKAKYERSASIFPGAFIEQEPGAMAASREMLGRIYQMDLPQLRALAAQEEGTAPQPTVKPDASIPSTAVAAPAGAPPAAGAGQDITSLPSNLQANLPAPPSTTDARANLDKTLEDYLGRSEEREKRLMESLGSNRLQGKAFQEYENQLRKDAERAGADREEAKSMALVKAGLAMMAGTSQHALENIGKGAMAGIVDYQAAAKDLKKAERERTKEFALIEQARRAEEQNDLKRRDELLMRASDAAQKRDDFGTKAIMDLGIKDQDQAFRVWDTQYRVAGQIQAANIAATSRNRPGISATQLAKFRENAIKNIDQNMIRGQVAKQKGLKKVPAPGADKKFDADVSTAYESAINEYIQRVLGGVQSSANSLQGFRLVTDEE